ncbi:MAG TPA: hypothetical protein VIJ10_05420 [Vicinamibacteria bacterium]
MPQVPTARPAPPRPPARAPRAPAVRRGPGVLRLVAWPAALTLAVTLLRLVGELRGWSPSYFSRAPGGGLAIVGIVWLVPFVGAWMGYRLVRAGVRPPGLAELVAWPLGALGVGLLMGYGFERMVQPSWTGTFLLWALVSIVVGLVSLVTWPALGVPLAVYAILARLPVVVIMAFAIFRRWGTHYDAPPPGFPALLPMPRWLWTGVLPQSTIWIALTLAVGMICGAAGVLAASRRSR